MSPSPRHQPPRTRGRSAGLLLLVNIVPLTVLAVLGVMYAQGEIEIKKEEIPAGMTETLIMVGVILVGLFLAASISLPAAHDGVKSIEGRMRRGGRILRGHEAGSRVLVVLCWPFLAVTWSLAWVVRFILIVLSFALLAAMILALCRLRWPELGQDQIDWVLELPERIRG